MSTRDQSPWGPEDDELVRAALMSLMDDVSAGPLPEPETVRARAEGRAAGVTDLGLRRSRRRSFALLAAAAAAAVVAGSAGLFVANQSPDRPVATSTTQQETSSTSTTLAASRVTMLDARSWSAVLGRSVETTTTQAPDGRQCFEPAGDATWTQGSPRLGDGSVPATQWIGTAARGATSGTPQGTPSGEDLASAVEDARERCADLTQLEATEGSLSDGAAYRAWLVEPPEAGQATWWVEVTDGPSLSFVSLPQTRDRTYSPEDVEELARAVIGEVRLTTETTSSSSASSPSTSSTPSTAVPTGTDTATAPETATGTGTSTSEGTPTGGTGETSVSVPPTAHWPIIGPAGPDYFVPSGTWDSPALTGGAGTTWGPLELEGPPYIESCTSGDVGQVSAVGVRSGPGDANYFARQYLTQLDGAAADRAYSEMIAGFGDGTCPGPAIGGTSTALASNIFRISQGDFTYYVGVARLSSGGVTVLHLAEAQTAPEPLTDSVATSELERVIGQASQR